MNAAVPHRCDLIFKASVGRKRQGGLSGLTTPSAGSNQRISQTAVLTYEGFPSCDNCSAKAVPSRGSGEKHSRPSETRGWRRVRARAWRETTCGRVGRYEKD